jgi:acetate kinase
MNVLVFNCGSSSQGFKVFRVGENQKPIVLAAGKARNVATKTQAGAAVDWQISNRAGVTPGDLSTHRRAAQEILAILRSNQVEFQAIGHRFLHGGELFQQTTRIDAETLPKLQDCFPLAPIHNPASYSVIEVCSELLPGIPQYAIFDTAFHTGMPELSKRYAIPRPLAEKYGFRKYGFHGLSYQYVSARAAELIGKPMAELKLIICHLGTGGSSVVAVKDGRSLDTSMGYTPLPGLVMSTRCGDIDAQVVLELVRQGYSVDEVTNILNNQSGLIALSGFSSNLAEVIEAAEGGNVDCQVAFAAYAHRLQIYLGGYTWLLGGADAIIFTDDIGLKSWKLREKVCSGVENLGIILDVNANRRAPTDQATQISSPKSRTQIWIVPTDEELVILNEVLGLFAPDQ